jgi:hypothetical protein
MGKQSVLDDRNTNVAVKKKPKKSGVVAVRKRTAAPSTTEVQETKLDGSNGNAIRDAFYAAKRLSSNGSQGIDPTSSSLADVSTDQQLADKMKKVEELTSLVKKAKAEVQSRKKKMLEAHLEAGNSKALEESPGKKSPGGLAVDSVGSASRHTAETSSTAKPAALVKVKKISIKKKSKASIEQESADCKDGDGPKKVPFDKNDSTSSQMTTDIEDDNEILEVSSSTKRKKKKSKSFIDADEVLKNLAATKGEESISALSIDVSTAASTNSSPNGTPTEIRRKKRRAIKVVRKIETEDCNISSNMPAACQAAIHHEGSLTLERSRPLAQRPSTPTETMLGKRKKERLRTLVTSSLVGNAGPNAVEEGSLTSISFNGNHSTSSSLSPITPVDKERAKKVFQPHKSLLVDLANDDEESEHFHEERSQKPGVNTSTKSKKIEAASYRTSGERIANSSSIRRPLTHRMSTPDTPTRPRASSLTPVKARSLTPVNLRPTPMTPVKPWSKTPVPLKITPLTSDKPRSSTPVNLRPIPSTSDKPRTSIPVNMGPAPSTPVKSFRRSLSLDGPMQSPMNDPNSLIMRIGGATRSPKTPARRGVRGAGLAKIGESKISDSNNSSPVTPLAPSELGGLRGRLDMITPICADSPSDSPQRKAPKSVMSKRNLFECLFEQKNLGGSGMSIPDDIAMTPRTLKRGFVALNTATPATARKAAVAPPKRIFDGIHHDHDRARGYADSAVAMLTDKSNETEIRALVEKIDGTGGFPATRRLSMRDNELVGRMTLAIRNDPSITSIEVTPDVFGTISSSLLAQFIDALRINLHVKSLDFSGVELGNDFLYSLAPSLESNFVIEEIDLSMNLFTNAGLAEFCQALANSNDTCKKLNLENQTTPISNASEFFVLEAFRENTTLYEVKLDFQSEDAAKELEEIIQRNRTSLLAPVDKDDKLLTLLRYEAERSEELYQEQNEEEAVVHVQEDDWNHLYELSVLFDKRKLKKEVQDAAEEAFVPATQKKNGDSMSKEEKKAFLFGEFRKNLGESIGCFNSDGSFLTDEFIAKYFKEDPEEDSLTFDFHGQWKLFKRFPVHDPDRATIVNKFIDALVGHSRAHEITGINMANTGCGDDFLIALGDRCLHNPSLLPNLYMINFETNFINEDGVCAIAKLIASPNSLKFLQVIRLEVRGSILCLHF